MKRKRSKAALQANVSVTQELGHLCSAVNDASSRTTALWFSFLTFMAYLTMAVGSVTHVMLFQEKPIKLPVLNVDLPLVAFFWIAPIFFVVFHFYLLLQTVILVRKISAYREMLEGATFKSPADRGRYSAQLDTFPVVQLLVGPDGAHGGFTSRLLQIITVVSFAVAPILLLLQFQFAFLPYHDAWVTWVHRCMVVLDLALIWVLWSSIKRGDGKLREPAFLRNIVVAIWSLVSAHKNRKFSTLFRAAVHKLLSTYPSATVGSTVVIIFSLFFVAFPSERIGHVIPLPCPYERIVSSPWSWPWSWSWSWPWSWSLSWSSDCIFPDSVNMVVRKPRALFSNVLVLPGQKLTDESKTGVPVGMSVRGRDLEGAILIEADLRRVDFTGAKLDGARLDGADLRDANFSCISEVISKAFNAASRPETDPSKAEIKKTSWPDDSCTWLVGTSLVRARLQGASFLLARMERANLTDANLEGAHMRSAYLHDAILKDTHFQGTELDSTFFGGADLTGAQLIGATLNRAQLQDANITDVVIDLSVLREVCVRGAKGVPRSMNLSYFSTKIEPPRYAPIQSGNVSSSSPCQSNTSDKESLENKTIEGSHETKGSLEGQAQDLLKLDKEMRAKYVSQNFFRLVCNSSSSSNLRTALFSNNNLLQEFFYSDSQLYAGVRIEEDLRKRRSDTSYSGCPGLAEMKPIDFALFDKSASDMNSFIKAKAASIEAQKTAIAQTPAADDQSTKAH